MLQTSSRDAPKLHGLALDRKPSHVFWIRSHNRRKTGSCLHQYPMLCPDCKQTSATFKMLKRARDWTDPECSLQTANHQEVRELLTQQPKPQPSRGKPRCAPGQPRQVGQEGWGARGHAPHVPAAPRAVPTPPMHPRQRKRPAGRYLGWHSLPAQNSWTGSGRVMASQYVSSTSMPS